MIYIKGSPTEKKVLLKVEGRLDRDSLPVLRNVCERHWKEGRSISLDLSGIYYVGMAGRDFLADIKQKVRFIGMSQYLKQMLE